MEFQIVESAVFTRRIARMGLEAELRELQLELLENPTAGNLLHICFTARMSPIR